MPEEYIIVINFLTSRIVIENGIIKEICPKLNNFIGHPFEELKKSISKQRMTLRLEEVSHDES